MNRQTLVAWVDMLHLLVIALIMIVAVAVASIKPPSNPDKPYAAGSLMFYVSWPAERNADVDLWILPPGDHPVGYSHKNGVSLDLLRDDRGALFDQTGANFEIAFTRGIIPGQYVVNLVLYDNDATGTPVPVHITVALRQPGGEMVELWNADQDVTIQDQEYTVRRFTLDKAGRVTTSDTIPVDVRSAQ